MTFAFPARAVNNRRNLDFMRVRAPRGEHPDYLVIRESIFSRFYARRAAQKHRLVIETPRHKPHRFIACVRSSQVRRSHSPWLDAHPDTRAPVRRGAQAAPFYRRLLSISPIYQIGPGQIRN